MAESRPQVTPIRNGALRVVGLDRLKTPDGDIECGPVVALCRCGRSGNKPFCDGTHVRTGFTTEATAGSEPDRRDDYVGQTITIHDNRDICAHAGYCTEGLPSVFRWPGDPWIDANGDSAERIIETVRKCPSGALSYSIDGVEFRREARPPTLAVTTPGPYEMTGEVELDAADWAEGASTEHYQLCRCGGSRRKPFCDGSHWTVWKDGAETRPPATRTAGPRPTVEEPHVAFIHELASNGLTRVGEAGPMTAMGVPRNELPTWDDIQIMAAQLDPRPLLEDEPVGTDLVIGPRARKPLHLDIPLFVSDMSFGALSEEAKLALAQGAELAGTGICSGEGGMLPEEQAANSHYLYEYASGAFGFTEEKLSRVQALHFKAGQGAKTGTGGHLPGAKVVGRIAEVRGLEPGTDSISPATFPDLVTPADFAAFADRARESSGGIPIGFKMSANRIEPDIDFALDAGADYIILDGRGGGTGAAPRIFRDNISVPTIAALARARAHLDRRGVGREVTLIVTGGLRAPEDFVKALALGADGIALANAPIQAVGCIGARLCHTDRCPSGVATQDPALRALIDVGHSARRVARFFESSVRLMQTLARACGHDHLGRFRHEDIATWQREMVDLAGIAYAGASAPRT